MKTASLYLLAFIAAVQILLLGLLSLSCNNAVLGFMCGACIPECFHVLKEMREGEEDD